MENGIKIAKSDDIPALCSVWRQCFPDSDEYIRCFYKENFNRISVLTYCLDGKPVSMMHLIDSSLKDSDRSQEAKFIYATGTLSEHRGKGFMGELIKAVTKKADEEGFALFLKPSSQKTMRYYQKFGFSPGSGLSLLQIASPQAQPLKISPLSAEEYNSLREAAFSDTAHASWDDAHIGWCIEENAFFSGKTLEIRFEDNRFFLLAYPEKDRLIIDETDLSASQLEAVGGSLCSLFKTQSIEACMPAHCSGQGENKIPILSYNSVFKNPYINLIMI